MINNKISIDLIFIIFLLTFFSGCTGIDERVSAPEWEEFGPYDDVDWFSVQPEKFPGIIDHVPMIEIDDKLTYIAKKDGKEFIVHGGEAGKKYDDITFLTNINDKPAYQATEDRKSFIVFEGKEIGKQFNQVYRPVDVGDKLAYIAKENGKFLVIYDGNEIGTRYEDIPYLMDIDGKPALIFTIDDKSYIVYDGKEIETQYTIYHLPANSPIEVNGKVAYIAVRENKSFIVYDGKEIGTQYDHIFQIFVVGEKMAYTAFKNESEFVVYDNKEIWTGIVSYESIHAPFIAANVESKMLIMSVRDGKNIWIYEGKEINPEDYDYFDFIPEVYDLIFEIANMKCKEIETQYDYVSKCFVVGGKQVFRAEKDQNDQKWILVYDGKEIETQYSYIGDFVNINGKLAFIAEKGGHIFIVIEK